MLHTTAVLGYAVKGTSTGQCTENLWRCAGIVGILDFQRCSTTSILPTMICILGSYFHMHISWGSFRLRLLATSSCEVSIANPRSPHVLAFDGWDLRIRRHHLCVLRGATSIAWVGHQIHMSSFRMRILDSGTTPYVIPTPSDLFRQENIFSSVLDDSAFGPLRSASPSGIAHHFYVAIAFLGSSFPCCFISLRVLLPLTEGPLAWGPILSINLATAGQLSIRFADNYAVIAIYPNIAKDSACALSLFYHHVGIGGLSVIGASASASIRWIRDRRF